MQGVVISLVRLAWRLAIGLAVALGFAVVIALVRDDSSFLTSLRVGMLAVGYVQWFLILPHLFRDKEVTRLSIGH